MLSSRFKKTGFTLKTIHLLLFFETKMDLHNIDVIKIGGLDFDRSYLTSIDRRLSELELDFLQAMYPDRDMVVKIGTSSYVSLISGTEYDMTSAVIQNPSAGGLMLSAKLIDVETREEVSINPWVVSYETQTVIPLLYLCLSNSLVTVNVDVDNLKIRGSGPVLSGEFNGKITDLEISGGITSIGSTFANHTTLESLTTKKESKQ